jgi:hypothetical protein
MAFTKTSNLHSDQSVILADYAHAARVFGDQGFRLAPKFDFLFHCSFKINTAALKNANIVQRYGQEINLMVKSIDLPNFTIQTETLNQYNRKKNIQYQHSFGEVTVKFHDDNMGLINQLWQNYYSYYYADSTSAQNLGAYTRNATQNSDHIPTPYGLDNKSTNPFFSQIKVYQMARHEYVCYTLINPIITSFDHARVDYSSNKTREFSMKFKFEAVTYSVGAVGAGDPEGFELSHYDTAPSPLQGVNPDPTVIDPSFVQALDTAALAPGILNNAISQINANQNAQANGAASNGGSSGINVGSILGGLAAGAAAIGIGGRLISSIGNLASGIGLPDISFPGLGGSSTATTEATPSAVNTDTAAAQADAGGQGAAPNDQTTTTDPNADTGGGGGDGTSQDPAADYGGSSSMDEQSGT